MSGKKVAEVVEDIDRVVNPEPGAGSDAPETR
jgi:hypothetical protein